MGRWKRRFLGCLVSAGLTVGMGAGVAGAQTATDTTIGCGSSAAEVTLQPQAIGTIDLASHDPARHEAFITLDAPLAAGDYEIFTVAADDHFDSVWYQATEQYRVSLGGNRTPMATPDLPQDSDWFHGSFSRDLDRDLSTVPDEVTASLPGWSMGEVTIDAPTDQLGFHHVQTEGVGVSAEVNSILPMSVTIRCTSPQLTPALSPTLILDKRVDGIDADGESTDIEEIEIGVPFMWVVELLNAGEGAATGIVLEDQMPPGVVIIANQVSASKDTIVVESTKAVWTGSLLPGESVELKVPALISSDASFELCLGTDLDPSDELCTNQARVTAVDQLSSRTRRVVNSLATAEAAITVRPEPEPQEIVTEPPVVKELVETVDPDPTPELPALISDPSLLAAPAEADPEPPAEALRAEPAELADPEPAPVVLDELPFTGPADALADTMGFAFGLMVVGAAALMAARRRLV